MVEGAGRAAAFRQLVAIDAAGRTAAHSGEGTLGRAATSEGRDCAAAGNLLASLDVPAAMVAAFEADPSLPLAERLVRALEAGVSAGGEEGPVHSAGCSWPATWSGRWSTCAPTGTTRRCARCGGRGRSTSRRWTTTCGARWNPEAAPAFGVPGIP